MSEQDPIVEIAEPTDRSATQLSIDKFTTKSVRKCFRPVDLIPSLVSRSQDWYREFGFRGS